MMLPDELPDDLKALRDESIRAQQRVDDLQRDLRKARKRAKEAHTTFDHALQEHFGQMTLLDLMEEP